MDLAKRTPAARGQGHAARRHRLRSARLRRRRHQPVFWGYFPAYDWVAFVGLFGGLEELPFHFPQLCLDIKQWAMTWRSRAAAPERNRHHALADARWTKEAWAFLASLHPGGADRRTAARKNPGQAGAGASPALLQLRQGRDDGCEGRSASRLLSFGTSRSEESTQAATRQPECLTGSHKSRQLERARRPRLRRSRSTRDEYERNESEDEANLAAGQADR